MPTVPTAAAAIGVRPEQILKSLVFEDRRGVRVVAIARGTGRIDRRRLALATGLDRPVPADPAVVLDVTGYPAGGVPPIGHRFLLPVIMDVRVAELDVAYGGAGTEDALLRISPSTIRVVTNAVVADIVGDSTTVSVNVEEARAPNVASSSIPGQVVANTSILSSDLVRTRPG